MKKFDIWLADLNPAFGTEPGKVRPVVIIQTNLLNGFHPSVLVCPITTKTRPQATLLRVHLEEDTGLNAASDIMVDQIRAIDARRMIKKLGELLPNQRLKLDENIKIVLDLP